MIEPIIETEGLKGEIIQEMKSIGACDNCTLRYLGVKDPAFYRDLPAISTLLENSSKTVDADSDACAKNGNIADAQGQSDAVEDGITPSKLSKINPCVACLGLLQNCVQESFIDQIVAEIKKADIEACSYAPMLTLPLSLLIRAHSIWFHLIDKFPQVYKGLPYMRPEGVAIKSVWKWICTIDLKHKVDSKSEWLTNGDLVVNMFLKYKDENFECLPLFKIIREKNNKRAELTRGIAEQTLNSMKIESFHNHFKCPPPVPTDCILFDTLACSHMAVFVAGRYCKFSRDVSQSPWLDSDGKRVRGEGSVQEFIVQHVTPIFNCDSIRFSASGREDSDVRMLGNGRPFVLELINPKKTIFTQQRIKLLQTTINESTSLISVRDLQIVDKKDLGILRDGEETKNKRYTALCKTPGREITPEMLQILNETKMPLILQQVTPLRVLHRRSLMTRPRSILEMRAEPAKRCKEMFILHVKTEAGTYVKEFVHGDFGRTEPSVSDLLGIQTEILALDVAGVELDWPPCIED